MYGIRNSCGGLLAQTVMLAFGGIEYNFWVKDPSRDEILRFKSKSEAEECLRNLDRQFGAFARVVELCMEVQF